MNFFLQESTSDRWLLPYSGIVLKALWVFLLMWQKRNARDFKRDYIQMTGMYLRTVPWKIRIVPIFFAVIVYQSTCAYKSVEEAFFSDWRLRHVLEERSFYTTVKARIYPAAKIRSCNSLEFQRKYAWYLMWWCWTLQRWGRPTENTVLSEGDPFDDEVAFSILQIRAAVSVYDRATLSHTSPIISYTFNIHINDSIVSETLMLLILTVPLWRTIECFLFLIAIGSSWPTTTSLKRYLLKSNIDSSVIGDDGLSRSQRFNGAFA